jgi:xanthine dehydrogenase accessory factor
MTAEDLLESARQLGQRGEPYALVTVVRTSPPTSAYVGAQAIVLADGRLEGSVGGGCAKEVVVTAALAAMRSGAARLVLISNASQDAAQVEKHAMRCASNGEIELFIHPHTPAPLLLVLGATPTAVLARSLAAQCGFRVTDDAGAPQISVALVATQGEGDEPALQAALASPAREVLLVASRTKAARLREAMQLSGVSEARLAALQAPAGPDIGAHSPAHIALAAVAGAVACWQKGAPQPIATLPAKPTPQPVAAPPEKNALAYVNPVCGAAVTPAEALHTVAYGGQTFYFCCDGCRQEFDRDPARYAAIQAAQSGAAPVVRAEEVLS